MRPASRPSNLLMRSLQRRSRQACAVSANSMRHVTLPRLAARLRPGPHLWAAPPPALPQPGRRPRPLPLLPPLPPWAGSAAALSPGRARARRTLAPREPGTPGCWGRRAARAPRPVAGRWAGGQGARVGRILEQLGQCGPQRCQRLPGWRHPCACSDATTRPCPFFFTFWPVSS